MGVSQSTLDEQLTNYAKKDFSFTPANLTDYAKKTDLNDFVTPTDLNNFVTTTDLTDFSTQLGTHLNKVLGELTVAQSELTTPVEVLKTPQCWIRMSNGCTNGNPVSEALGKDPTEWFKDGSTSEDSCTARIAAYDSWCETTNNAESKWVN